MLNRARESLNPRLVSFTRPTSAAAEQYRRLRQRVEELCVSRPSSVLAVTSPIQGDGKTLTALNLAGALAQRQGARVLVVDADLRRPSIATELGLPCANGGIEAALRYGDADIQDFIELSLGLSVSVLPCAGSSEDCYQLLTSGNFSRLLEAARSHYEYIILDTPPLIPVSDATLMKSLVDGYVIVVAAGSTPRRLLGEALNQLGPDAVLGLVFNRDEHPLFGYYGSYYGSPGGPGQQL